VVPISITITTLLKVSLLVSKLPDLNSWTLASASAVTVALLITDWNHPATMESTEQNTAL